MLFKTFDKKLNSVRKQITVRDKWAVNVSSLQSEVAEIFKTVAAANSFLGMINQYNAHLSSTYDNHIPLKHGTIVVRPNTQWFNALCRSQKQKKRHLERKFMRTGLSSDEDTYK